MYQIDDIVENLMGRRERFTLDYPNDEVRSCFAKLLRVQTGQKRRGDPGTDRHKGISFALDWKREKATQGRRFV